MGFVAGGVGHALGSPERASDPLGPSAHAGGYAAPGPPRLRSCIRASPVARRGAFRFRGAWHSRGGRRKRETGRGRARRFWGIVGLVGGHGVWSPQGHRWAYESSSATPGPHAGRGLTPSPPTRRASDAGRLGRYRGVIRRRRCKDLDESPWEPPDQSFLGVTPVPRLACLLPMHPGTANSVGWSCRTWAEPLFR